MIPNTVSDIIADQTKRALWEVENVIACIPEDCWDKEYGQMPLWKHIYHMLHSLDLWFINPRDPKFHEPLIHEKDLNNLDVITDRRLDRLQIQAYYSQIQNKIKQYINILQDENLLEMPAGCDYTKFTLLMAQHRHLHTHMGMIMGFIVAETGLWSRVVGLEGEIPQENYEMFF